MYFENCDSGYCLSLKFYKELSDVHPSNTNMAIHHWHSFPLFAGSVNFLTADGTKFSHPLHHLGKTAADLPVLAIDSFRHMYLFKHDAKSDLE